MDIKKLVNSKKAYRILDGSNARNTTWLSGGCKILADALNIAFGYTQCVIYNTKLNFVEHFGVINNSDQVIDGDGITENIEKWVINFANNESVNLDDIVGKIYNEETDQIVGIPSDYEASKKLAELFKIYGVIEEEVLKTITEDYPPSFNMDEFKKLNSFASRKRYCDNHLERLASGSGRIVYKIDEEKVLKLAKNKKGVAQNETEVDQSNDYMAKHIVAKTYDHHPDGLWVEAELCKKITPKKFKEVVGVSFGVFKKIVDYELFYRREYPKHSEFLKREILDDYWENEFIANVLDYAVNFDLPRGDLRRISTYGLNSNNEVVIVDYGLTQDVFDLHYKRY